MPAIETTPELVRGVYSALERHLDVIRRRLDRPLTYAEKIFLGHMADPEGAELEPGSSYAVLRPDRVAMQDATAQMALLQFMLAGKNETAVATTVHCDHLIQAHAGADADMLSARETNHEIYDFLRTASGRYGIGFWGPGAGIIHQVVLEKYAFPGGMMIGTDSHTPNAGGLGMFACGVGGADAVDVMAGFGWEVLYPAIVGIRLTGELGGWASPKDVILKVCEILTVSGGTNRVIEYFGPGTRSISATGKATITNMGAELGATTSIFPYDERMAIYLEATGRAAIAELANDRADLLKADSQVESDPERFFAQVVEIDLSKLEPQVAGPHTPDLVRPVSRLAADAAEHGYPDRLSSALIGSCTNSSYEDLERAADVARQASRRGVRTQTQLWVTPGSEQIHRTIRRDGQLESFEKIGATVLANACGPCIGQWRRDDVAAGEENSIINSYNRNFRRRNDGNAATNSFIASPEIVVAFALAGRVSFNPLSDEIEGEDGVRFRLVAPAQAPDVPVEGFVHSDEGYFAPLADGSAAEVEVAPDSERLELLKPFPAWDGRDFEQLPLLLKSEGKCTTDHISPAGRWLRFRGHLDRLSDNMFTGVVNGFTGKTGEGLDQLSGERDQAFSAIARRYRAESLRWVVVGDWNYGEGSSREHAAMSPRLLGCAAVIVRSFPRLHEANLKKQGVLPLTFVDPTDFDLVLETDRVSIRGLADLAPGGELQVTLHHEDGSEDDVRVSHSFNDEHIRWFQAGSAVNLLRAENGVSS
ncbi:MAG: aconitate hydratase [Myxococcota bacterium]